MRRLIRLLRTLIPVFNLEDEPAPGAVETINSTLMKARGAAWG